MEITAIRQQQKRPDRYSVFVDGAFAFGLSQAALLEAGIAVGQPLDAPRLRQLKGTAAADRTYQNALRYVALRPRSEWEVREYLRRKGAGDPAAARIAGRLRRAGLLDDTAFARSWVRSRRLLKPVSLRRLKLELRQKQLAPEIVTKVLAEEAADDHQTLRVLITKKRQRYPDQRKLEQYLARQGFRFEDIRSVLAEEDG